MNRNEKIKVISQAIYDDYIEKGWKNVSTYDCEAKAMHYVDTEIIVKKLTLTNVSQQRELLELVTEIANSNQVYSNTRHKLWAKKLISSNCG